MRPGVWAQGLIPGERTGTFRKLPGQEDPLEEDMATHSTILGWEIPRTEEPGGLQTVEHNKATEHEHTRAHTPSLSSPRDLLCSSGHANRSEETSHRSLLEASLQSLPLSSDGLLPCAPLRVSLCCKNPLIGLRVHPNSV